MLQTDGKIAYYQTGDPDSKTYALQLAVGTTAYADLPAGHYDCWLPAGVAAEHVRYVYLPRTVAAPTPTIAPWAAPTAAVNNQVSGVPAGADGGGMAPATGSPIRLLVVATHRLAVLYSAAGPVTMYATKVL